MRSEPYALNPKLIRTGRRLKGMDTLSPKPDNPKKSPQSEIGNSRYEPRAYVIYNVASINSRLGSWGRLVSGSGQGSVIVIPFQHVLGFESHYAGKPVRPQHMLHLRIQPKTLLF